MNRLSLFIILSLVASLIGGCAPQQNSNAEEIKKALFDFDPAFKDLLAKKADLDLQIESLNGELRIRQSEINSKIMQLEEELKSARRENYAKIRDLKTQLEPERQNINITLRELRTKLSAKEAVLRTLRSSLKEKNRLLENKKLALSQQERSKLLTEIGDLNRQILPLEEEAASVRKAIKFYKQELTLLRQ